MVQFKFFQIDAFAEKPFTGNPAGVLLLDKWIEDEIMQNIAMENNLSETAFVVSTAKPDQKTGKTKFTALQLSKRGGKLYCTYKNDRVLIAGKARPYLYGKIQLKDESNEPT